MVNHTAIDKNTTNSLINFNINNDQKCPFKNSSSQKYPGIRIIIINFGWLGKLLLNRWPIFMV